LGVIIDVFLVAAYYMSSFNYFLFSSAGCYVCF